MVNTRIPTSLPPVVTGNRSPYPTVVIVTYAHQIASVAVRMFASGDARSACSTRNAPASMINATISTRM